MAQERVSPNVLRWTALIEEADPEDGGVQERLCQLRALAKMFEEYGNSPNAPEGDTISAAGRVMVEAVDSLSADLNEIVSRRVAEIEAEAQPTA